MDEDRVESQDRGAAAGGRDKSAKKTAKREKASDRVLAEMFSVQSPEASERQRGRSKGAAAAGEEQP